MKKFFQLIACIIVCQSAGLIGSIFTFSSIENWYSFLNKPSFSPPNWVFGPTWTLLYTLMGIAIYLIIQAKNVDSKSKKPAYLVFAIQLLLNATWSIVFFGLQSPFWGFINIILMWTFIVASIISFSRINKIAAGLLVPYLLWVSFASVLNYYILILN
jgi:benzodiazapine receptor